MHRSFVVTFLVAFSCVNICSAQSTEIRRTKFSPQEIKEDLQFLYETLEQAHYNLYVNTEKSIFEKEYKKIYGSIRDSQTVIQITRLFQPFAALSKLAHCNMGFPFSIYFDRSNQDTAILFPFLVTMRNNRAFVIESYSNFAFKAGDEILSIDGIPINVKFQEMYNFLSGEGNAIKNTLIDLFTFPRIYWWIFGSKNYYNVNIKRTKGSSESVIIGGIKAAEYEQKLSNKKSVFNLNREFRFIGDIAYLHPGIFINNQSSGNTSEQTTFATGEFMSFIDSAFREIHKKKPENLIIDLRGNPGGDNAFSDPMIAYFATKPFKFCSTFSVKTSGITKGFWKDVKDSSLQDLKSQILTRKDGEIFEASIPYHSPRADSLRFKGNVYVLVDRYSYSNAVSVGAIIQDYRFGSVIGEPTADVASSYGATHQFRLPNSQLDVSYPKAFMVRPNGDKTLKGVTPDLIASDDPFTENDEILDFTIKYIRRRN